MGAPPWRLTNPVSPLTSGGTHQVTGSWIVIKPTPIETSGKRTWSMITARIRAGTLCLHQSVAWTSKAQILRFYITVQMWGKKKCHSGSLFCHKLFNDSMNFGLKKKKIAPACARSSTPLSMLFMQFFLSYFLHSIVWLEKLFPLPCPSIMQVCR